MQWRKSRGMEPTPRQEKMFERMRIAGAKATGGGFLDFCDIPNCLAEGGNGSL